MNVRTLSCIGALLAGSGCLTDPGDLGAVGGTSGTAGNEGTASGGSGEATGTSTGEAGGSTSAAATSAAAESDTGATGEETGSTGEPIDPGCAFDMGPGLQRALTSTQFEHAIEDLFGVVVDVEFGSDATPFDASTSISIEDSVEIVTAAETVAAQFVAPPCAGDMMSCGQAFIDDWAPTVLRGQADTDALMDVYALEDSYTDGVAAVLEAMITAPAFAMVTPTGTMQGEFLELDGPSVATRLSLLLWNSVPDAELLDAAPSLTDPGGVAAQLDRMFDDPRYARAQADLYGMLTRIRSLPTLARDAVEPTWSEPLAEAMIEEQRRFVGALASDADATLEDLLGSSATFVNAELAALYGDDLQSPPPVGESWDPAQLDPQRRGGLLTRLGFITRNSTNVPASAYEIPTRRGRGVLTTLGCLDVPPPPPSTPPAPSAIQNREEWQALIGSDQTCTGCHVVTDELGYAFGNYDGLGRWHESGDSAAGSSPIPELTFDGAVELSAALADDPVVDRCLFALRQHASEADTCTIDAIQQAFSDSGGNLRVLVETVATSEAFLSARP